MRDKDKGDDLKLSSSLIHKAAHKINNGGVVVYPTRSLYGLGADIFDANAVHRVYAIKMRPWNKPLSILVKNMASLETLVKTISADADILIKCFWPGKLTLVLEASSHVPEEITSGTGKVGVRRPEHPAARALVEACRNPITATSANLSGKAGCDHLSRLDASIQSNVDMLLDGGLLRGGLGSTVVDVTGDRPVVLREGSITTQAIHAALSKPSRQ